MTDKKIISLGIVVSCLLVLAIVMGIVDYRSFQTYGKIVTIYQELLDSKERQLTEGYGALVLCREKAVRPIPALERRILQLQPGLDPGVAERIFTTIRENCVEYQLNESLVVHLIFRESSFNILGQSKKDACGLMMVRYTNDNKQIVHPKILKEVGVNTREQLFHIEKNIKAGCKILREKCLDKSKTIEEALQKYVGGKHKTYIQDIFRLMSEYEIMKEG